MLQQRIDDGDSVGFATVLLEEEDSTAAFSLLMQENQQLVQRVLLDAILHSEGNERLVMLVQLRTNGFLTDPCFLDYWEVTGAVLPNGTHVAYDHFLIHELMLAYRRDSYALRAFVQMRESGAIDDTLHNALVKELGFDYMDQAYIEEHQLAPLLTLTDGEKAAYEAILVAIDEGDCMSVVETMLVGEVTPNVYGKLYSEDSELIDFVIAQAMGFLSEGYRYQDLVRLRVEGFVSDTCFEIYWDMVNSGAAKRLQTYGTFFDTDLYLLAELTEIADTMDDGTDLVSEILNAGLLNDGTYFALIDEIGIEVGG